METLNSVSEMNVNGFKAGIKRADRLKDIGRAHGLPSGYNIPLYPIENLPGSPLDWVREMGSYVVPVDPEWGLWFDWTSNDGLNTSIVPSVKGMNPITGLAIDGIRLEQYKTNCPKHNKPFLNNRFCEDCGYSWPMQNYVSSPNTLWWDGFRQPDGKVRQFFFSADEERDVASHIIGKQNTVPAFGFAFYKTKVERKNQVQNHRYNYHYNYGVNPLYEKKLIGDFNWQEQKQNWYDNTAHPTFTDIKMSDNLEISCQNMCDNDSNYYAAGIAGNDGTEGFTGYSSSVLRSSVAPSSVKSAKREINTRNKSVSIGAGAEIAQELLPDTLELSDWNSDHSALMRLYFCFPEQFETIKRKGIKQFTSKPNGFLNSVPVG